jgi:muramoyltetrapeptide carboxypeptidase
MLHRSRGARWPPPLAPGARIALVTPAGPLRGEAELTRAIANVRAFGWEPRPGDHALARSGYFAGDDATRLRDLAQAIAAPDVDGIWCLRGGYGATRLLESLDLAPLLARPKALIGFSDITALHSIVARRTELVSFHAPTARQALSDFSRSSMHRAVVQQADPCGVAREARVIRAGVARGRLAGGNLALVAALCGTPFAPPLDDSILVLEDVNEPIYRVDRMLTQLRLAGMLDGCAAIAFGQCTSCAEESDDGARSLDEVLEELAERLGVPCVAGLPVGHIPDQWTIPLGAAAELDAGARRLMVETPRLHTIVSASR